MTLTSGGSCLIYRASREPSVFLLPCAGIQNYKLVFERDFFCLP